jgi:hypothetical protein
MPAEWSLQEQAVEALLAAARKFKKHPSADNLNEVTRLLELALSTGCQAADLAETPAYWPLITGH